MLENNSKIFKETMALFVITLISGLALSFVYKITKNPIEIQAEARKEKAYKAVYPEAEDFEEVNTVNLAYEDGSITIEHISRALDLEANTLGYVVTLSSNEGYSGDITIVIGYSIDGIVKGIEVLEMSETPGLGSKASETEFRQQFFNKKAQRFISTKTETTADNEIYAISGATITTDAMVNAVNVGVGFIKMHFDSVGGGIDE